MGGEIGLEFISSIDINFVGSQCGRKAGNLNLI